MNGKKARFTLAATLLAALLGARAPLANQVPGTLVTGHITSISGMDWIKVDGHPYRIKSGSAAAAAVQKMSPGQMVDLQLNGPANTAASEVINIVPHSGT